MRSRLESFDFRRHQTLSLHVANGILAHLDIVELLFRQVFDSEIPHTDVLDIAVAPLASESSFDLLFDLGPDRRPLLDQLQFCELVLKGNWNALFTLRLQFRQLSFEPRDLAMHLTALRRGFGIIS